MMRPHSPLAGTIGARRPGHAGLLGPFGLVAACVVLLAASAQAQPAGDDAGAAPTRALEGRWLDYNAGLLSLEMAVVAPDPTNPDRVYAASRNLLYRTLDGGERWERVWALRVSGGPTAGAGTADVSADVIDALTDEQVDAVQDRFLELQQELLEQLTAESDELVAAEEVEEAADDLLLQAIDEVTAAEGPRTEVADETELLADRGFTDIAVDPLRPSHVFAASGSGLLRSTDFGHSWEVAYRGTGAAQRAVTAIAVNEGVVVIATGQGLRRSVDGGATFEQVPGPPGTELVTWVATAPGWPDVYYALAGGRLFRSEDRGETWAPEGVPQGVSGGDARMLAVDPEDPDRVYLATASGLYVSDDGGRSLELAGSVGLRDRDARFVAVTPRAVLLGTSEGIYASGDGAATWSTLSDGLSASVVAQLDVGATAEGWTTVWAATSDGGIFQLLDPRAYDARTPELAIASQRWGRDPSLQQTIQAALRHHRLDDIPVAGWGRRIWWSRFAPTVRAELRVYQARDETTTFIPGVGGVPRLEGFDTQRQDDWEFRVMLLWDVTELITGGRLDPARTVDQLGDVTVVSLDPTVTASREAQDIADERQELINLVVRLYDTRRDMILRQAGHPASDVLRRVNDELAILELGARLDAVTGGFFSTYSQVAP
jgi:hypothetical protein